MSSSQCHHYLSFELELQLELQHPLQDDPRQSPHLLSTQHAARRDPYLRADPTEHHEHPTTEDGRIHQGLGGEMDYPEHSPRPFQGGIMSPCPISTGDRVLILSVLTLSRVPWLPLAGLASLRRCTRPDGPPQAANPLRAVPGWASVSILCIQVKTIQDCHHLLHHIIKTLSAPENTSTLPSVRLSVRVSMKDGSTELASSDLPVLESGAASFPRSGSPCTWDPPKSPSSYDRAGRPTRATPHFRRFRRKNTCTT